MFELFGSHRERRLVRIVGVMQNSGISNGISFTMIVNPLNLGTRGRHEGVVIILSAENSAHNLSLAVMRPEKQTG